MRVVIVTGVDPDWLQMLLAGFVIFVIDIVTLEGGEVQ